MDAREIGKSHFKILKAKEAVIGMSNFTPTPTLDEQYQEYKQAIESDAEANGLTVSCEIIQSSCTSTEGIIFSMAVVRHFFEQVPFEQAP